MSAPVLVKNRSYICHMTLILEPSLLPRTWSEIKEQSSFGEELLVDLVSSFEHPNPL